MNGVVSLGLIVAVVLATLYAIGRVGDVLTRWHARRDRWSAQ
jgi:hypothetical protein